MHIPKLKQFDAVRIRWADPSALSGEWQKPSKKDMTCEGCVSVGLVHKVHSDRLTIICSWDPINKHVNGGITIPFSVISKIEVLK